MTEFDYIKTTEDTTEMATIIANLVDKHGDFCLDRFCEYCKYTSPSVCVFLHLKDLLEGKHI